MSEVEPIYRLSGSLKVKSKQFGNARCASHLPFQNHSKPQIKQRTEVHYTPNPSLHPQRSDIV